MVAVCKYSFSVRLRSDSYTRFCAKVYVFDQTRIDCVYTHQMFANCVGSRCDATRQTQTQMRKTAHRCCVYLLSSVLDVFFCFVSACALEYFMCSFLLFFNFFIICMYSVKWCHTFPGMYVLFFQLFTGDDLPNKKVAPRTLSGEHKILFVFY